MAVDRPRPGHPALWLVLLLAGQAATLRLIQAGPRIGYQHYLSTRTARGSSARLARPRLPPQAAMVAMGRVADSEDIGQASAAPGRGASAW